ncbi:universal stress protein [Streptomyces sp. NPDC001698]|uniref:universal stress protein n=1 Tax=Streptomyces sp. NPDC001698 TaxID=3364601 RepID=UPI00367DC7D7
MSRPSSLTRQSGRLSRGCQRGETGDEAALESQARTELAAAVEETVGSQPPVEVRTEVRNGTAATVLLDAARDASLLVVGSRGLGGFSRLLLGSVAQHCTQYAACPVVVIRSSGQ